MVLAASVMAATAIARLAMVGKYLPRIKAWEHVDSAYIDRIKETSLGYPNEVREKFYYFNGCYCDSANFSINKLAYIFSRLMALTIIH